LASNGKYAALNPPQADCRVPSPTILEFDPAGNWIQGWGGPSKEYEWPDNEQGVIDSLRRSSVHPSYRLAGLSVLE
jgi:hypothetical protein